MVSPGLNQMESQGEESAVRSAATAVTIKTPGVLFESPWALNHGERLKSPRGCDQHPV
jgi:hypothetical protein